MSRKASPRSPRVTPRRPSSTYSSLEVHHEDYVRSSSPNASLIPREFTSVSSLRTARDLQEGTLNIPDDLTSGRGEFGRGETPTGRRWPVIDPNTSRRVQRWDVVVTFLLCVTALLSPFETAFLEPRVDTCFFIDRFVDLAFLADLVLQFFLAYAPRGRPTFLVRTPERIVRHYLRRWFWIDLLSILPIDIARVMTDDGARMIVFGLNFKTLRLLRLLRLLKLARFSVIMDRWHTSFGFSFGTLSLIRFFVIVVLCCHWMACLWGGLAMYGEGDGTWLEAVQEAKGGADDRYKGPGHVYLLSLYWAIITLTSIGYGDVTPQTDLEYVVSAICTAIMASLWTYVIGAVCGIVSTMEPHEVAFKRTLDDLNWLMRDRQVPQEMCIKLRRYLHETREMKRWGSEHAVVEQLSPQLKGEFAHFLHKNWIEQVWYFATMPDEVILVLSRNLVMEVFCPHEAVISDRTLFIIQKGICALKGKILVSGDVWGEDMLLSNRILREQHHARALSYLTVLQLHVSAVVDIVQNYPETRAKLRWAQVQIAIMRGVQKIAEVTYDLEKRGSLSRNKMSENQRLELYSDILNGRYSQQEQGLLFHLDYMSLCRGQRDRPFYATTSVRSTNRSSSLPASSSNNVLGGDLYKITSQMDGMAEEMQDLSAKVDRLLRAAGLSTLAPPEGGPRGHSNSGNGNGGGGLSLGGPNMRVAPSYMTNYSHYRPARSANSRANEIDFGPVIMPSKSVRSGWAISRQTSAQTVTGNNNNNNNGGGGLGFGGDSWSRSQPFISRDGSSGR